MMNSGISVTCEGIIIVLNTIMKQADLPLKFVLAKP